MAISTTDKEKNNNVPLKFLESGLILLDKPKGISSFQAVKIVSKSLGNIKAGHMGTLDPEASGLLIIGVNKATKLFNKFLNGKKEYYATFQFGYETDTLDSVGSVTKSTDLKIAKNQVFDIIDSFVGKQLQIPPIYSAKKINGLRAYDLARKNIEITLKPNEVELYNLSLINKLCDFEKQLYTFKINCSSGFYVRSLGRDIANKLSTYATTTCIRRTKCCGFDVKNANSLEDIKNLKFSFISLDKALKLIK